MLNYIVSWPIKNAQAYTFYGSHQQTTHLHCHFWFHQSSIYLMERKVFAKKNEKRHMNSCKANKISDFGDQADIKLLEQHLTIFCLKLRFRSERIAPVIETIRTIKSNYYRKSCVLNISKIQRLPERLQLA